ncbi:hypothetical protein CIB95_04745 [Lottiidibacillus patelloidae]|uniref:Peptidase S54 rhomboid domain-containing protein n=1 Tax=Lottiidibacillus patelloidae TaxID=2670334 RepID=A0A263BVW2_9BACI|nr:rhomboid family intramembrane serine protease [Lottiidibacillus patelloidae]OZM57682.1 hypothetical protein CIB95_04745 [Lottiidibacillus patelloidae]
MQGNTENTGYERLFWKVIAYYVLEKEYSIAYTSHDEKEVWLESENGQELLRLCQKDLIWGNDIRKDIENFSLVLEEISRGASKRKIRCRTVYFSKEDPVLQYNDSVDENKSKGLQHSHIVFSESASYEGYTPLISFLNEESNDGIKRYLHLIIYDFEAFKAKIFADQRRREKEFNAIFNNGKPIATFILLAINVIMYLLLEKFGGSTNIETLVLFGAKNNLLILEGEWWRFITPMFLHIGFFHLIMNSIALYYLGMFVEKMYGTTRFLFIYFIAGIIGSLASFAFNPQISAGASGAIFGCFGALLYFGLIKKELFFKTIGKNLLFILAINLILGFSVEMIDNSGHIGGLIGGFLAAAIVQLPSQQGLRKRFVYGIAITLAASIFTFWSYNNNIENPHPLTVMQLSQQYIDGEQYSEAYDLLISHYEHGQELDEYQFLLSYTEIQLGKYLEAIEHLQNTIQLNSKFHEAHFNLALVYLEVSEHKKALSSAEKALQLNPDEESYENLYNKLKEATNH